MKIFLLLILLLGCGFSQDKINSKEDLVESKTASLSEKEKAYQKYKQQKEAENKKLEENGFCSCNND